MDNEFDYLIIGGGSAGCALALLGLAWVERIVATAEART